MLGAIVAVEGTASVSAGHIELLTKMLATLTDEVLLLGGTEVGSEHQPVAVPRRIGELGAVAAALSHAGADHLLVIAADIRHPSLDLLRYLSMVRAGHEAVVPEGPDGVQPLLAVYHARLAGRAQALASTGAREMQALLEDARVRRVGVDEVAKFGSPRTLLERGPI